MSASFYVSFDDYDEVNDDDSVTDSGSFGQYESENDEEFILIDIDSDFIEAHGDCCKENQSVYHQMSSILETTDSALKDEEDIHITEPIISVNSINASIRPMILPTVFRVIQGILPAVSFLSLNSISFTLHSLILILSRSVLTNNTLWNTFTSALLTATVIPHPFQSRCQSLSLPLLIHKIYCFISRFKSDTHHKTVLFWSNAIPIYIHCKLTHFVVEILPVSDRNKRLIWNSKRDFIGNRFSTIVHPELIRFLMDYRIEITQNTQKHSLIDSLLCDLDSTGERTTLLLNNNKCMKYEDVENAIKKEFHVNSYRQLFSALSKDPISCSTFAQVHEMTMSGGFRALIKVYRELEEKRCRIDVYNLRKLDSILQHIDMKSNGFLTQVLDEYESHLDNNFDFLTEAKRIEHIRSNFISSGHYSSKVLIPQVMNMYSTKHIIVKELISGVSIQNHQKIQYWKLKNSQVFQNLAEICGQMIFIDGFCNISLKNTIVLPDGRIVLNEFDGICMIREEVRRAVCYLALSCDDFLQTYNVLTKLGVDFGTLEYTRILNYAKTLFEISGFHQESQSEMDEFLASFPEEFKAISKTVKELRNISESLQLENVSILPLFRKYAISGLDKNSNILTKFPALTRSQKKFQAMKRITNSLI
uniref:ABC1 atypical kinase-like domain-containing protein n=1 Tax=Timspurckia oligopyrenoides TaxID=708627 RepID=A0A7S0ZHP2_9RHOD